MVFFNVNSEKKMYEEYKIASNVNSILIKLFLNLFTILQSQNFKNTE